MLREVSRLVDFQVHASDGPIGRVDDILLDEDFWIVRGIVVELSPAFGGTRVIATPAALKIPYWEEKVLPLKIPGETAARLPLAPDEMPPPDAPLGLWRFSLPLWLSSDAPDEETETLPPGGSPPSPPPDAGQKADGWDLPPLQDRQAENTVRCRNAVGYRVSTCNGVAGRFRDFLVSDVKWVVRYLLIETGPLFFRRKVMVVPEQVDRVNRAGATIELAISADELRHSQRYGRQTAVRPATLIEQQNTARAAGARGRR